VGSTHPTPYQNLLKSSFQPHKYPVPLFAIPATTATTIATWATVVVTTVTTKAAIVVTIIIDPSIVVPLQHTRVHYCASITKDV
jgi:hypothetical protein